MNRVWKILPCFFKCFFAFCVYVCFCVYNLFLPICNWHRLLHDHDRHRLRAIDRVHFGSSSCKSKAIRKIAIQAARPGVPRHIGEGVAVTLPHDLHRAKPPFWLEHCCKLLLPVRAVTNLPETTMIRAIPILTDLFRRWGPVEEGGREEITYDLTNLTWQVGT